MMHAMRARRRAAQGREGAARCPATSAAAVCARRQKRRCARCLRAPCHGAPSQQAKVSTLPKGLPP